MHLQIKISFIFAVYLCLIFVQAKRSRIRKMKVERSHGMVIVRHRSLDEPLPTNATNPPRLDNVSYDDIYSEWSKWSKCRKRCKQVRTRVCKSPAFCQSTILKEERNCTGDRCQARIIHDRLDIAQSSSHHHSIDNHRGRGRSTQFRVLYHLQSYVYSQWSEWSSCTKTCHTRRYRACEMKQICGNSIIQEDALCYTQGSSCEKLYKSKTRENNEEERRDEMELNMKQVNHTKLIDDENCGYSSFTNDVSRLLRIIGGREAHKGRWPWIVAILNRNHDPFCGGTLISPQFVITAAHCVRRRLYVRAGEHDLMMFEGSEQQIRVSDIFVHPEYDADTVDNDIALLKLRSPLKINKFVSPICLPSSDDVMSANSLGTILGWGKRRNSAVFGTDVLHQAQVPIADVEDCKNVYKEKYMISENMVCAGYKKGKVDSCAGDSGGPLLFNKKGGERGDKWFLYGITSFGEGCGKKNKYGIYVKVPNLVSWIRKTIQNNSS